MKYRIWDETRKEYVQDYDDFHINPDGELSIISLMWEGEQEWCKPDRYIIEQYTGLKDKNGKEIFEGDVIEAHSGEYYMGVWEYESTHTIEDIRSLPDVFMFCDEIEIIGNIHEGEVSG